MTGKQQRLVDESENGILLIPEGLRVFAGAKAVMTAGQAGIFHKLLDKDAFGTEFFTNAPCLAYVLRGQETFFDADGAKTVVASGDTLLLPRHHHMVSDFRAEKGPLEAWLFFFSDAVIDEFLKATSLASVPASKSRTALFEGSASLRAYIDALPKVYGTVRSPPALVKAKLLEVLLLLHMHDRNRQLQSFLANENAGRSRRNIKQLMRVYALADLSIADYATLSGRSVSSFQRDFKREFGEAPSVWLRRAKLEHAHEMVINSRVSISEIAHAAGYADTSHFIKAYKSCFQQTPKQLRQSLAGPCRGAGKKAPHNPYFRREFSIRHLCGRKYCAHHSEGDHE